MVSTVLGLAVRVCLVSFRRDAADALKDAEDAVIDATRKFAEQLTLSRERLQDFESQVDSAAKASVERVNLQVENLSKNHAERLTQFFSELTSHNQEAFISALTEVKGASFRLSDSLDSYAARMQGNLTSIESRVAAFTDAITDRLKTTTFPDDYFARHLEAPLAQLKEGAATLAGGVMDVNSQMTESSAALTRALTKLRQKAGAAEDSMETVVRLSAQQQGVLDAANGQVSALAHVSSTLSHLDTTLQGIVSAFSENTAANAQLRTGVHDVVNENSEARRSLASSLESLAGRLDLTASATASVALKLDANAVQSREASSALTAGLDATSNATKDAAAAIARGLEESARSAVSLAEQLGTATAVSSRVAARLDDLVSAEEKVFEVQNQLTHQAVATAGRVGQVLEELREVMRQFPAMDQSPGAQAADLKPVPQKMDRLPVAAPVPGMAPDGPPAPVREEPATASTDGEKIMSGQTAGSVQ